MTEQIPATLAAPSDQTRAPRSTGLLAVLIGGILFLGLWTVLAPQIRTGYVSLAPGPAPDAQKLTKIDARTYSSQGSFHLTTALVSADAISLADFVRESLDNDVRLIEKSAIYPANESRQQSDQQHAQEMTQSQQAASIAALHELGLPVSEEGALINEVRRDGAEAADIKSGDVIVRIDSTSIVRAGDIRTYLEKKKPGDVVSVIVDRGGSPKTVRVKTVDAKDAPGKARLGIITTTVTKLPFKISIDAKDIGGPSAGLIFAVGIYDLLEPTDLTGGKVIAGTGEITPDGTVGKIGAVAQKIRGAERIHAKVFLVPKDEFAEAKAALRTDMKIIPVSTLHDALEALRKLR
jgi:PDZ domain-containing protein